LSYGRVWGGRGGVRVCFCLAAFFVDVCCIALSGLYGRQVVGDPGRCRADMLRPFGALFLLRGLHLGASPCTIHLRILPARFPQRNPPGKNSPPFAANAPLIPPTDTVARPRRRPGGGCNRLGCFGGGLRLPSGNRLASGRIGCPGRSGFRPTGRG